MKVLLKIVLVLSLISLVDNSFAQRKRKKRRSKAKKEVKQKDSKAKKQKTEVSYQQERLAQNHFFNGMKYYMLEDYQRALVNFKKSFDANPNNAGCNFQIGQIYLGSNMANEALPFCQRALILNPENLYYHQLLAQCFVELKRLEDATNSYETIIATFPEEDDYYFDLANIYLQLGKVDKGLDAIGKIEKKYGVNQEIIEQKQQIYLSINKFDKAVQEGEKLIAAFPNEPRYKVEHARLYLANDNFKEAKEMLLGLDAQKELDGHGKALLSDIHWSLGEKEDSEKQLLEAFEDPEYSIDQKINILIGFINKSNRVSKTTLEEMCHTVIKLHSSDPKVYIAYGDFLIKEGRKKESRNNYLKALDMEPSYFKVWQNVVIIDSDLGETDSIITHSNKALELFPNQGVFWYYNGASNLVKKDYKKATYSLEKAQNLINDNIPFSTLIYAQLGDSYHGEERYIESDKAYEKVLEVEPNNVHVLNNYSYFLSLRNEKLDKAKQMCETLITLEPNNSTYLDTYAWVLYKDKKYDKAKELLEKALKSSEDGTIVEHYGDVLYQLGNKQKAFEQWEISKSTGDYSNLLEKKIKDKKLYDE